MHTNSSSRSSSSRPLFSHSSPLLPPSASRPSGTHLPMRTDRQTDPPLSGGQRTLLTHISAEGPGSRGPIHHVVEALPVQGHVQRPENTTTHSDTPTHIVLMRTNVINLLNRDPEHDRLTFSCCTRNVNQCILNRVSVRVRVGFRV